MNSSGLSGAQDLTSSVLTGMSAMGQKIDVTLQHVHKTDMNCRDGTTEGWRANRTFAISLIIAWQCDGKLVTLRVPDVQ
jgi:hypothetical protein